MRLDVSELDWRLHLGGPRPRLHSQRRIWISDPTSILRYITLTSTSLYTASQFMNPGPAPKPPAVPTPSRMDLHRAATTIPTSSFDTFPAPASPAISQMNNTFFPNGSQISLGTAKTGGSSSIVKEGYVRCKEDKLFAGWNRRYLILREFRLDFMKDEHGKLEKSISLNTVTGVSRSEEVRMAFELTRVGKEHLNPKGPIARDVPTKTITCEVRSDDEIYEWIDKIYERCPGMGGVSNPTNFNHRIHVGFDPQTGGFVGLPQEWEKLLTASAITKEDYKKNPQAVIEVLEFYSEHKMREQHPEMYASSIPTPPASSQNKQLGYSTGNSITPPRQGQSTDQQRFNSNPPLNKYQQSSAGAGAPRPQITRAATDKGGYDMEADAARIKEIANQEQERRRREAEAKKARDQELQKRKEHEDQERRELDAYNASLPKSRPTIAQQEIGGGYSPGPGTERNGQEPRYNPARAPPSAPNSQNQGPNKQLVAHRPAPTPSNAQQASRNTTSVALPSGLKAEPNRDRQPSPNARYQPERKDSQATANSSQNGSSSAIPRQQPAQPQMQQVKPLNVQNKQLPQQKAAPEPPRKDTEAPAATKKPEERTKEVRMSSMSESEVMSKLKQVVSKDNPNESYSKQKKIGQGASGSVYVARVKETATSAIAREIYRTHGPKGQVAIKQMDLRSQPRKELIVNEIIVMKDSKHPNIVNFLDSFLQESNNELWVVMEFMEGGPLTDVIDNNPVITEEQISAICYETCKGLAHLHSQQIIHRDIKSDNVLLDRIGNVKISKSIIALLCRKKLIKTS